MILKLIVLLALICVPPILGFQNITNTEKDTSLTTELEQPFRASFLYINDNYIAAWWPDYNDQYFGADDFLTVSLLARLYLNPWKYSITYSAITLRKFNSRYDLLSATVTRKFTFRSFNFSAGAGIVYKGNLGGETMQNGVHRLGNVKTVEMPYSKQNGTAFILHLSAEKVYYPELTNQDRLYSVLETRVVSDYMPSRFTAGFRYQLLFYKIFQIELLTAYRGFFNSVDEYSEMIRPGLLSAVDLKINFYKNYFLDIGFALLPTKNILSDAIYSPYKNDFLPQAWISLSWDSEWLSLLEHLDY